MPVNSHPVVSAADLRDMLGPALRAASERIYECSKAHGFWDGYTRNDGEMIALMHSELSEALEAIRHGNPPSEKIPDYRGAEEELADCIIRILDMAAGRGYNLAGAIVAKMIYNEGRPYKHGKAF